jgi:transcriptional regulator with XRE-family HTH domain
LQTGVPPLTPGNPASYAASMDESGSVGARTAALRKLRGLTGRQLASRAAVSYSLLTKVETGQVPPSQAFVSAVARALHVSRAELLGQPYRSADRQLDAVHGLVAEIRRELIAYRLPPADDEVIPSLAELGSQVAEVSAARHQVDLVALGGQLPIVLATLRTSAWHYSGTDREQVMGLLAEVYYAARQFLHKLGYADLATLVADRYEWAAMQSGDPHAMALAAVFRAGELDAVADWGNSRAVMASALERHEASDDAAGVSVHGFLHLMAAYMSAHAGDSAATWSHHSEAKELASRLGRDGDAYRLAFGPTNVSIWGTALGVELMDGPAALERARHVRLGMTIPPERVGHHFIDLARAHLMNGSGTEALGALVAARRVAPQQTRYHPQVRETVHALAAAERRSSETLRGFATWVGIED